MRSVLILTLHKTASTFMSNVFLPRLAEALQMPFINAGKNHWITNGVRQHPDMHALAPYQACVLGPVRDPRIIPDPAAFDPWRKVLLLREPRDVLTSQYFHDLRRQAVSLTIDDYILEACAQPHVYYLRYLDYLERFANRPNLLLLRYEDMVANWPAFLDRTLRFCGARPSADMQAELNALSSEFVLKTEDPAAHKRQIKPGDAFRKLRPETIAAIDARFAGVIAWLGRDREAA